MVSVIQSSASIARGSPMVGSAAIATCVSASGATPARSAFFACA
jgi:hypothetical protein